MFKNALKQTVNKEEFNVAYSANGAKMYGSSTSALVDLNFQVTSLRLAREQNIQAAFMSAYAEDPLLAIKWLFYARDIWEGLGERRIFRVLLRFLVEDMPETITPLLRFVPQYGRWDDLVEITDISEEAVLILKVQLAQDIIGMKAGKPISLLAKWLPSVNASSEKTRKQGKFLAKKFFPLYAKPQECYRKTLSKLRRYLQVTEVLASANQWAEIDYNKVPSKANLRYANAFFKHDEARRRMYLENLKAHNGTVKINARTVQPYEIVRSIGEENNAENTTFEEMWKEMESNSPSLGNVLLVLDTSSSMLQIADWKNKVSPFDVAKSFACMSDKIEGEFHDMFMTFSDTPTFVDFSKLHTLREKVVCFNKLSQYAASTNIASVFHLLLQTAKEYELALPEKVLIITDMQFNSYGAEGSNIMEELSKEYQQQGYKLPKLIFWNVSMDASQPKVVPMVENKNGVLLVSGFSPQIFSLVQSGKTSPLEALKEVLLSPRYSQIVI